MLAAAGIDVEEGLLARLAELVEGEVEVIADATVLGLHRPPLEAPVHALRGGEEAKSLGAVERLWRELRLGRDGTIVAFGGGCTTDAAGFAAATYLRGVAWVAVPTTLVGQVDAAIGGKTAVNLPEGKNLVGAFHWPERTAIDPALLETLPESERRAGMAEVVKTGLLAGEPLWELPTDELVRRCAAYKAAVCLRDPYERGERAVLNLGHTFAHALEAAGDYHGPSHGEAVALGLLAALRLSGLDTDAVEEVLAPQPVRVNRDAAWAALARDKKSVNGTPRLVLLEAPGRPVTGVELPEQRGASRPRRADRGLESPGARRSPERRQPRRPPPPRPEALRRAEPEPARDPDLRVGEGARADSPTAARPTARPSTSAGATTPSTGPAAWSSTPARGRTTATPSATRSSCLRCRSWKCTSRTSTSARTGGGTP